MVGGGPVKVRAYYNGQKISVSDINSLDQANGFYGSLFGSNVTNPEKLAELLRTNRQRGFGDLPSYASCDGTARICN